MVGDIYWYHADDIGGWIIDWRTKGPYSHVCVEVRNNAVIEAKWPRVQLDVPGKPTATHSPHYPDAQKLDTAIKWLYTTVGDAYDLLDIMANGIILFFPHAPLPRTPTAFTCSELTATFLLKAGYDFPASFATDERSLSVVSPNDLARVLGLL